MITKRDREIVRFLSKIRVASTNVLAERFFPSLRMAQKRLALLTKWGEVQRSREHMTSQYVYYLGSKPKQIRHSLLRTEFYHRFPYKMPVFEIEYIVGRIRADAMIGYIDKTEQLAFLEIQISRTKPDLAKYRRFYNSGEYQDHFPTMPKIIIVTDHVFYPPEDLDVITYPTKLPF